MIPLSDAMEQRYFFLYEVDYLPFPWYNLFEFMHPHSGKRGIIYEEPNKEE